MIDMDQQIRDLVHTIKSTDLTPAQIKAAFGEIYLSKDTINNQLESQEIVTQFQIVKAPTFGASIPNTTAISRIDADSGLMPLLPSIESNKTYVLLGVDAINNGSGAISVSFGYSNGGDFVTLNQITLAGTETGTFNTRNAYTFDSSGYPTILVTSGAAADLSVQMVYAELVQ